MGFFRGFFAPFRGAVFVTRARIWHLVILPILLNVALAAGAAWAAAHYWKIEFAGRVFSSSFVYWVSLVAVVLLTSIVGFILLQPILGAVFNDILTENTERRIRSDTPRAPFFASLGRSLAHGLLKLILYAFALLVGTLLSIVTAGIGSVVGVGLAALFLAYDGFDFPLARRSFGFWAKWRYLALHPAQTIGYGLGATIFYLVPLALVVAPPFTAVGATLVFLETESRREKKKSEKGRIDETSPLRDGQG